jgi:hypothetical protein
MATGTGFRGDFGPALIFLDHDRHLILADTGAADGMKESGTVRSYA